MVKEPLEELIDESINIAEIKKPASSGLFYK